MVVCLVGVGDILIGAQLIAVTVEGNLAVSMPNSGQLEFVAQLLVQSDFLGAGRINQIVNLQNQIAFSILAVDTVLNPVGDVGGISFALRSAVSLEVVVITGHSVGVTGNALGLKYGHILNLDGLGYVRFRHTLNNLLEVECVFRVSSSRGAGQDSSSLAAGIKGYATVSVDCKVHQAQVQIGSITGCGCGEKGCRNHTSQHHQCKG